jgi:hypothetical protein
MIIVAEHIHDFLEPVVAGFGVIAGGRYRPGRVFLVDNGGQFRRDFVADFRLNLELARLQPPSPEMARVRAIVRGRGSMKP